MHALGPGGASLEGGNIPPFHIARGAVGKGLRPRTLKDEYIPPLIQMAIHTPPVLLLMIL